MLASNTAGRPAVEVRKVGNGELVERVVYYNDTWNASAVIDLGATVTTKIGGLGSAYDPRDVEVLDDVSGNSIQEVVVVGRRTDDGQVRVQLRDALSGTKLRNIDLP